MLRSSPLFQLYLVRLRDFYRQPARVFWVYGFPTLLAIALGFAFQNRPPAPVLVDLVRNRRDIADQGASRSPQRSPRPSEKSGRTTCKTLPPSRFTRRLRKRPSSGLIPARHRS